MLLGSPYAPRRGFTLIELVAVVLLVSLLFTAAALSMQNLTGARLKRDAYVLAQNIGALHTRAVTKNAYYRMVFDLDNDAYSTEVAETRFFLGRGKEEDDKPLFKKKDSVLKRLGKVQFTEDAEGPTMHQSTAQEVKDALIGRVELSRDVKFDGVLTTHQRDEKKEGKAYLYFFPNGFVEKALLYLTDGDRSFTLETQPLTGRVTVRRGKVNAPSGFDREEEYSGHF